MTDEVLYAVSDGIATITLNRPGKLNAINRDMNEALFAAWRRFEADTAARVAILTASGDRAFCVGRDLSEAADGIFTIESFPVIGISIEVTKPTIAAVNGLALGGGFLLAQMCDLCVAANSAAFSIPEAKLGRGAAWAAPLVRMLPPRVAMELLTTAASMPAERLYQLGFVNAVVPLSSLAETAGALAASIVANAPLSVRACGRMVRTVSSDGAPMDRVAAEALFKHVYESEDAREGLQAFRERRAPQWKGK
jgi:enoyl-CoA hydratase/carnithine racemase